VLPLWPNQLLVHLGAHHVALIYRSGLTKKVLSQRERSVQAGEGAPWRGALQAVSQMLDELDLPASVAVKVTLASEFVRYLVLPVADMRMAYDEKQAYAQAAYREIFGAESLGWLVKCDDAKPSTPSLCTAIDESLWDALQAIAQKYQLNLRSVQPYFIRAINALSRDVKSSDGIVVVVEPARLVLASVRAGVITQVRTQALALNWQQDLQDSLARTALLEDDLGENVLVYAPSAKNSKLNPINDWKMKRIAPATNTGSLPAPYAMLEVFS
jgi:hypothetical protein